MTLSRYFPWSKSPSAAADKRATLALAAALVHLDEAAALQAIAQGGNVNAHLDPPQASCSRTFLQHAILNASPVLFRALLQAGANPMATPESGCCWPAPHLATLHEDYEAIDVLRAHPGANFDQAVLDPLVGEASTARDIAVRRGRVFADWFGQRFSLTEAARPPVFEDENELAMARWRDQRKPRP